MTGIEIELRPDLSNAVLKEKPFPHFVAKETLNPVLGDRLLSWLEQENRWNHASSDDFYDSYDLNLKAISPPAEFEPLLSPAAVKNVRLQCEELFEHQLNSNVDVSAQKLIAGNRIKVHTDFHPGGPSHRLLIYLTRVWTLSDGGLLILLDSESPSEVSAEQRFYLPVHLSGVGFEISAHSFHAVSAISSGERYALKYTFYAA